jgi:hypothetical protein
MSQQYLHAAFAHSQCATSAQCCMLECENSTTPHSSMRSIVDAPAGCKFDFLTDSKICPSSTLRELSTRDVAHAADQDEPKMERENLADDTLHRNRGSGGADRCTNKQAHMWFVTMHVALWMRDKRLSAAVIFSTMAFPALDRLPPLQRKVTENRQHDVMRRLNYMDDAKIQLKPSMTIISMPNTDAGLISSSFSVVHNSMALYTVTDLSRCRLSRVASRSASLSHPLKCFATEISLDFMSSCQLGGRNFIP